MATSPGQWEPHASRKGRHSPSDRQGCGRHSGDIVGGADRLVARDSRRVFRRIEIGKVSARGKIRGLNYIPWAESPKRMVRERRLI
jgi:hypothetical protein